MQPQSPVPRVPTNKPAGKPTSVPLVETTNGPNGKPAHMPSYKPTTLPANSSKCKTFESGEQHNFAMPQLQPVQPQA
jgi:hypothetical protein